MNNLIFPLLTLIALLLIILNNLISHNINSPNNFNSPFECGFNNIINPQTFLSNNFFTFNLLFLILELEIILVIPFTSNITNAHPSNFTFFLIILLILITIINEWNNKILDWSN